MYYSVFAAVCLFAGEMFFKSVISGAVVFIVCLPFFMKEIKKKNRKVMLEKTEKQFCRALEIMSGSMVAGTTFENALKEVAHGEYTEEMDIISSGFRSVDRMVCLNCDITQAFDVFAVKSGSSDIKCFSYALESVFSAGGDVIALMNSNSEILRKKYEAKEEIRNCIAEPKLSHRIMTVMPVILIAIMRLMSGEYISYLYSGAGRIVMAVVLVSLLLAWILGEKIGDINV